MNVLLIGGSSRMIDAVIDKLNKGKHRIFLLTGRRDRQFSYKHVFERYDYPYEDESVKDIFESVKPDMVVFMGHLGIMTDHADKIIHIGTGHRRAPWRTEHRARPDPLPFCIVQQFSPESLRQFQHSSLAGIVVCKFHRRRSMLFWHIFQKKAEGRHLCAATGES